jgi:hypothetical protein
MTNGYQSLGTVDHGGMHAGRGLLRLDARDGATPSFTIVAGWTGELYTTSASTPVYNGGQSIVFSVNGLDIAIRYVVVIAHR